MFKQTNINRAHTCRPWENHSKLTKTEIKIIHQQSHLRLKLKSSINRVIVLGNRLPYHSARIIPWFCILILSRMLDVICQRRKPMLWQRTTITSHQLQQSQVIDWSRKMYQSKKQVWPNLKVIHSFHKPQNGDCNWMTIHRGLLNTIEESKNHEKDVSQQKQSHNQIKRTAPLE